MAGEQWWTNKTTRFVVRRICDACGGDSWGTYGSERRCHDCGRIVANVDALGGYVDNDDDD
ncbi:MAG: hypothetical protein ACJ77I_06735 [Chloroflexota bacterium]|jgi:hypothetical protein